MGDAQRTAVCNHEYSCHVYGECPLHIYICIHCGTPDWADLNRQLRHSDDTRAALVDRIFRGFLYDLGRRTVNTDDTAQQLRRAVLDTELPQQPEPTPEAADGHANPAGTSGKVLSLLSASDTILKGRPLPPEVLSQQLLSEALVHAVLLLEKRLH